MKLIRKMTREEALKVLEMFLHKQCDLKRTEFAYDANTVWAAVNMASKALEQEPRFLLHSDGKIEQIIEPCGDLLNKIRDEVCDIDDEIVLNPDSFYERKVYVRFSKVIDIIDKHKTESEKTNDKQ